MRFFMRVLSAATGVIYRLIHTVSSLLLIGIVGLVFAQVVGRYVFRYGIRWSSELTVYFLTWMVFLGCACAYKNNEIVSLTLLVDRLSQRLKHVFALVTNLIIVIFMLGTIYANTEIVQAGFRKLSSILKVPMWSVYISWSVAAGIMVLFGIEKIIHSVKSVSGSEAKTVAARQVTEYTGRRRR